MAFFFFLERVEWKYCSNLPAAGATSCAPCTNIHRPPRDPIFDIYQSTRRPFTQSQLLLLFAQLSGKEQQPRNLGSQFITRATVDFAGTQKFRGQMGVREASCLHDSTPGKPSGPSLSPYFRREGAEAELGEGEDTMTHQPS